MADHESDIRPWHLWLARVLLLIAVVGTLYGSLELWQARQLVRHGICGQAVVTGYKVYPASGKSSTLYQPILRLLDPAGTTWQKDDSESRNQREYAVGQTVEVIYPPGHPGDFTINTWNDVWQLGVISTVGGAFACLLFYGLLVYVRIALARPEFGSKWAWIDSYYLPLKILFRLFGR